MNASARLTVVAWLYILLGAHSCIEMVVGWFLPVERPLLALHLCIIEWNLAPLTLPLGIGILRRNDTARKLAVFFSWTPIAIAIAVAAVWLVILLVGDPVWEPVEFVDGDDLALGISLFLLGLPLFVWQLRVLDSPASRALTGPPPPQGREMGQAPEADTSPATDAESADGTPA